MDANFIEERKRKLRLILPVIVLPFITLLFYLLGGGKGTTKTDVPHNALSFTLPTLLDDTKPMDKLSLYQQAEEDSINQLRAAQYDPFAKWMPKEDSSALSEDSEGDLWRQNPYTSPYFSSGSTTPASERPTTEQLEQRMAELQKLIETPDSSKVIEEPGKSDNSPNPDPELQRLETMMQSLAGTQDAQQDAVLAQADNVLEKILDVQHPSRVMERLRKESEQNKRNVYAVSTKPEDEVSDIIEIPANAGTLPRAIDYSQAQFYDDEPAPDTDSPNALAAVVHEDQTLLSGATIKLRLEQNAYVQGYLIPKGSFVYGACTLNGERLLVDISSIRYGNSIFPVSLAAYDMDGLAGLRIPGSINRDASKEGTEQMMQALSLGSLNPSLGAQATSAGIDIAKNLLSRKVKLVKIFVKAGYPLLLANPSAR